MAMSLCLHGPRCAFDQRDWWYMHIEASGVVKVFISASPFSFHPLSFSLYPFVLLALLYSSFLPLSPPSSPLGIPVEKPLPVPPSVPPSLSPSPLLLFFLFSFLPSSPPARPPFDDIHACNWELHFAHALQEKTKQTCRQTYIHTYTHTKKIQNKKQDIGLETFLSAHKHRRIIRRTNAFIRAPRAPFLNKHCRFVLSLFFYPLLTTVSCRSVFVDLCVLFFFPFLPFPLSVLTTDYCFLSYFEHLLYF